MFKVAPEYLSTAKSPVFHIEWKSRVVSAEAVKSIMSFFRKQRDYSPANASVRETLAYLDEINAGLAPGERLALDQAHSIRNAILKEKIIKRHGVIQAQLGKIVSQYARGDILSLSHSYDFPPLGLLRKIFSQIYGTRDVDRLFTAKSNPAETLRGRDLEQFLRAENSDAESTFNQALIAEIAANNENAFVRFFHELGINHKTQEDLVTEQTEKYGRAVITPDLLFLDEVYINGERIHWIDYKDYFGTHISFLYKSNQAQARRYHAEFGHGAVVFHRGFSSDYELEGATPLDAGVLGVKFIERVV